MNKSQELLDNYEIFLDDNPQLTTMKAKYNACANRLNRNIINPGFLSETEEEELYKRLHVIKQLVLALE